jgi:hypothetical protein
MKLAKKSAMMTVTLSSIVILLFCFSSFSTPLGISSSASPVSAPAKISKLYSVNLLGSENWAGYAIAAPANSVSVVRGSWIEPAITCPTTSLQYASFWVGMDGLTSSTVEQTGTLAECNNGVASYSSWYEFFPSSSVNITSLIIRPGNIISAVVRYFLTTNKFTVTIKDVTTGKSFSHTAAVPTAVRNSAEWIAEAPSSCTYTCTVLPLANFRTVSFGKSATLVTGTDTATISGVTGPIWKFVSSLDQMEMFSVANTVKAMPSSLIAGGSSFSVTWVSAGP